MLETTPETPKPLTLHEQVVRRCKQFLREHETRAKKSSPNIYSSQNRLTKAQTSTDEAKKWKKHEKAETPNKWKKHEKAEISKKWKTRE